MIRISKALSTTFSFLVDKISRLASYARQTALEQSCLFCNEKCHDKNARLCDGCSFDLPWNHHCCRQCALPLGTLSNEYSCADCLSNSPSFGKTIASFKYEFPIRQAIHLFKYQSKRYVLHTLSPALIETIKEHYTEATLPEVLIPAPMDKAKRKQRHYNHALLLARDIGKRIRIPVEAKTLLKTKNTTSQTGLNKRQRIRNLKGAFDIVKPVSYRHVALIDDVMTTGATAESMAKMLLDAGVERVDIWCIARTGK